MSVLDIFKFKPLDVSSLSQLDNKDRAIIQSLQNVEVTLLRLTALLAGAGIIGAVLLTFLLFYAGEKLDSLGNNTETIADLDKRVGILELRVTQAEIHLNRLADKKVD